MERAHWVSILDDDGADAGLCAEDLAALKARIAERVTSGAVGRAGAAGGVSRLHPSHTPRSSRRGVAGADYHRDSASGTLRRSGLRGEDILLEALLQEPMRDLSDRAVWSVSTAKPGNGVEQLFDKSAETYWQSDGPQPHSITAQFTSKLKVSEIRLFLSFEQDESYTPSIISVRVGSSHHDLRVVRRNKELRKPQGWVRIALGDIPGSDAVSDTDSLASDEDDPESMSAGELAEREQRRRVRAEHKRREKLRAEKEKARARSNAPSAVTRDAHASPASLTPRDDARGAKMMSIDGDGAATPWGEMVENSDDAMALTLFDDDDFETAREDREKRRDKMYVRAHMLQIVIHCNHQNGRDSHVRRVEILGPAQQIVADTSPFSSSAFRMHECIR